jgi:hypothetical protein
MRASTSGARLLCIADRLAGDSAGPVGMETWQTFARPYRCGTDEVWAQFWTPCERRRPVSTPTVIRAKMRAPPAEAFCLDGARELRASQMRPGSRTYCFWPDEPPDVPEDPLVPDEDF